MFHRIFVGVTQVLFYKSARLKLENMRNKPKTTHIPSCGILQVPERTIIVFGEIFGHNWSKSKSNQIYVLILLFYFILLSVLI